MSSNEPSDAVAGVPLEALVADRRGRCEAVSRLQGGSTHYHEELGIFRKAAEERRLHLDPPPTELSGPPDEEGNEHQVWFCPESRSVLKATWPGFFGLLVVHRAGEERKASPIDYLERCQLHNELFGDGIRFLGILQEEAGPRLLIRQPAIAGIPATERQIERFFTTSGWRRFVIDENLAFFDPQRHIVISDTHRGNLIFMEDGLLAPIDLRVQRISGALLNTVRQLCDTTASAD